MHFIIGLNQDNRRRANQPHITEANLARIKEILHLEEKENFWELDRRGAIILIVREAERIWKRKTKTHPPARLANFQRTRLFTV